MFGFGILNDTEARAIHLGFALFLTFLAYPALKSSPRDRVPLLDWVLAVAGAFAGSYLFLFYVELSGRPGQPTTLDLVTGTVGILLLLEATRRALGLPMVIVACVFIFYTFAGQYMPDVIQHRGASLTKFLNHQWLTTEGVFGIALGVSTSFVFLFVLFGTLLEKAGAGNWMMQISIALLGHLRGGPAKVAVVSSALNGVVSGSSVSNVVSGGIFTIPLMKRTGLSGVKAGAIEASASINGQIMPPVMGAAAFLMVEYVGIPYSEIVKHALLPAVFSYIALLYMVHLEAIKMGLKPIPQRPTPARERMLRMGLGLSGSVLAVCIVYYGIVAIQAVFGEAAPLVLAVAGIALYVASLWYSSRYPGPGARRSERADPGTAARLGRDAHRARLPHPDRRASVVPDGRADVARPVGVLGDGDDPRHRRHAQAADGGIPQRGPRRLGARGLARPDRRAGARRPQHDRHRHRHRHRRHRRRHDHADRPRPDDDRIRRVHLRRQRHPDADPDRRDQPRARHGHPDHRQLHPGRHADGAGRGRSRRAGRTRRSR